MSAANARETDLRIVLTLLAFVITCAPARAQTFMELQNLATGAGVDPTIDVQLELPGRTVNAFGWFLVSEKWGEALLGVSKAVKPWLWLGVAAGLETHQDPFRVNPNVWIGKRRLSTFLALEYGGSGFWYKSVSLMRLTPRISLGVHSQRFYGTGPRVEVRFNGGYKAWASVVSGPQSLVGVAKSF